jgi:hypothetical protein
MLPLGSEQYSRGLSPLTGIASEITSCDDQNEAGVAVTLRGARQSTAADKSFMMAVGKKVSQRTEGS